YTGMDLKKQLAAQDSIAHNLRDLDKRQGFRGVEKNITNPEEIAQFLVEERDKLIQKKEPYRVIYPPGKEPAKTPLTLNRQGQSNLPPYASVGQIANGVVIKVDSKWGIVTVRFAEAQGIIDIDDMSWARKPDPAKHFSEDVVKDPGKVLKIGDVVEVRVK